MPEERFDILFSGQMLPGQDPTDVRDKVGRLFKASSEQVERLFSGKPAKIKKGVSAEVASRYRLAFRQIGALVEIRPATAASSVPAEDEKRDTPEITLLPPHTGSLEAFAPRITPAPLPDISGMGFGKPDTPLDETPPPPPAEVDTSALGLVPGQDWTLEDCQPLPLAHLEPDIDGMELVAPDDTRHIPPEPPPPPLPDISALQLEEPEPPQETATNDRPPKP